MTRPPIALERRENDGDRMVSPSAERNSGPIADAFGHFSLTKGAVLEIGCGTGQHAVTVLGRYPDLTWTATDADEASVRSCLAWRDFSGLEDRLSARHLDVLDSECWGAFGQTDLIYSANVIHISPIAVLQAIMTGAEKLIRQSGHLVLYGPFRRYGEFNAPSNAEFDASLKSRNPDWGIRDLDDEITPLANQRGFRLAEVRDMPANNHFVVFRRG